MITAPSTIRPKSIAPSDIRLPLTSLCTIPVAVISIDSGIASAQISAAFTFPSRSSSTMMTSTAPSNRLLRTVAIVASTSFVRFRTALATMPGGRLGWMSAILLSTAAATVRLLAPISMMAVPTTTSSPFSLADPVRSSRPTPTPCGPTMSRT